MTYAFFLLAMAALLLALNIKAKHEPTKLVSFILMWGCIVLALCWATYTAISVSVYTP